MPWNGKPGMSDLLNGLYLAVNVRFQKLLNNHNIRVQASQSIHSIHSKVEWNGLTLGCSILPVEWIHPIQNGWIDDGLIHVDSAHVKSYLSSAFDFCYPSGAEIR